MSFTFGCLSSLAGTKYWKIGPNWACTLPAPSLSVTGGLMKAPMSYWMVGNDDALVAARGDVAAAARAGVKAACSIMANWAATATPNPALIALRRLSFGL